jgi:hypothetical protein
MTRSRYIPGRAPAPPMAVVVGVEVELDDPDIAHMPSAHASSVVPSAHASIVPSTHVSVVPSAPHISIVPVRRRRDPGASC